MPYCAVVGCNSGAKGSPNVRTHAFPPGERLRKKWKDQVNRIGFEPNENSRVCSLHFKEEDYTPLIKGRRPQLKPRAYPRFALRPAEGIRGPSRHDHGHLAKKQEGEAEANGKAQKRKKSSDRAGPSAKRQPTEVDQGVDHEMSVGEVEIGPNPAEEIKLLRMALAERDKAIEAQAKELSELKSAIKTVYEDDQVHRLKNPKSRSKWSPKTLKKAIQYYYSAGATHYEMRRKKGEPWPSSDCLRKHLRKIPFEIGTLKGMLRRLKSKVKLMNPKEREVVLLIDELYLQAKREYDNSTGGFIGHPTISPKYKPNEQPNLDRLACHGVAAMVCGITTRWKQLIGIHYTEKSYDAKAMKEWIDEMITTCQEIGLKVRCVTMDMAPTNQNV